MFSQKIFFLSSKQLIHFLAKIVECNYYRKIHGNYIGPGDRDLANM